MDLLAEPLPGPCSPQDLFPSQARHALPTQCRCSEPIPELDVGPLDWRSGRLCPHRRGEPGRPARALAGARSADLHPSPKAGPLPAESLHRPPGSLCRGKDPAATRCQGSDSLDPRSWELPAHRGPAHQGPNSQEFGQSRGHRAAGDACVALMWTVFSHGRIKAKKAPWHVFLEGSLGSLASGPGTGGGSQRAGAPAVHSSAGLGLCTSERIAEPQFPQLGDELGPGLQGGHAHPCRRGF